MEIHIGKAKAGGKVRIKGRDVEVTGGDIRFDDDGLTVDGKKVDLPSKPGKSGKKGGKRS